MLDKSVTIPFGYFKYLSTACRWTATTTVQLVRIGLTVKTEKGTFQTV